MTRKGEPGAVKLESLKGWDTLVSSERAALVREHAALTAGVERLGKAWIEVGQHLKAIRDVLEPHRMFDAYLKLTPFGLSRATAYRRIKIAEKAKRVLQPNLFNFALLNGLDRVNVDTVKVIPPPKSSDPKVMREYLKSVSGKEMTAASDPEVMKKECINVIRSRYDRLPSDWTGRKRSDWIRSVCGMAMALIGVSGEQRIAPEAIPIDWIRGRMAKKAS